MEVLKQTLRKVYQCNLPMKAPSGGWEKALDCFHISYSTPHRWQLNFKGHLPQVLFPPLSVLRFIGQNDAATATLKSTCCANQLVHVNISCMESHALTRHFVRIQ